MKKSVLFSVFVACLLVVSNYVSATGVRSEFKEFEITPVEDLYVGKNVKAIWTVSYSENEVPVTVVKRNTLEGTEYVVHSKFFEVCYLASTDGFGTKEVRKCCRNVPKKITSAVINQEQMKRQQIITPNKVGDEKALGLIASYLPELINDGYTHLLN